MRFLFRFFQKNKESKSLPFSFLELDFYNHILPGLDDGSNDVTLSISLLVELKKLGFNSVISSPKTINQRFSNTPKSILRSYSLFISTIDLSNRLLPEYIPPISIYALDSDFSHIRKSGELLTTADNYVLVQFVDSAALSFMEAEIIELIYTGYKPILVHPERYISLNGNVPYFEALVHRGCFLGLSLLSLQGVYGKSVQKMTYKLLDNHLYSFVGTGIKNQTHVKVLKNLASNHRMMKKLMEYPFLNTKILD